MASSAFRPTTRHELSSIIIIQRPTNILPHPPSYPDPTQTTILPQLVPKSTYQDEVNEKRPQDEHSQSVDVIQSDVTYAGVDVAINLSEEGWRGTII